MTTPTMFMLHSTARGPANRTARAALPGRLRKKNYVGDSQLRLVHGRPTMINEDYLLRNLEELKMKCAGQILEVRTMDGRVLDLSTLVPSEVPASPPAGPNFLPDSINRDTPWGEKMASHHGDNLGADELPEKGLPELMAQAPREVSPDDVDTADLPEEPLDEALAAATQDAAEADEPEATALAEERVVSEESSKKGKNKKGNR